MTSTRRSALAQIAGGAAAVAALVTARSSIASEPDPIFAAIDQHRAACAAYDEAIKNHTAYEESGSEDKAAEAALNAAIEQTYQHMEYKAGGDLLETMPTTLAGIASLCRYFVPLLNVGNFGSTIQLPEYMELDDGETLTAAAAFANIIAKAVDALAVQS